MTKRKILKEALDLARRRVAKTPLWHKLALERARKVELELGYIRHDRQSDRTSGDVGRKHSG